VRAARCLGAASRQLCGQSGLSEEDLPTHLGEARCREAAGCPADQPYEALADALHSRRIACRAFHFFAEGCGLLANYESRGGGLRTVAWACGAQCLLTIAARVANTD
jgi:hypothetical protein